ncbi:MAG: methyltransferase domain-containing protein [Planctomycetaceae bacterium]
MFRPYGNPPRPDSRCPCCGSLERHRLFWRFAEQKTNLFDTRKKSVLHIAPEPCLAPKLRRRIGSGYLTADFSDPRAMVQMDITGIKYPDESFDVIYCSHVLEHVQEDMKAMRELWRVLKTDGWAVLLVPITVDVTYEDPAVTDPLERFEKFGQEDHVRRYGNDYIDRLRSAGFRVEMFRVSDLATSEEALRFGLGKEAGEIYFCRKV